MAVYTTQICMRAKIFLASSDLEKWSTQDLFFWGKKVIPENQTIIKLFAIFYKYIFFIK